MLSFEKRAPGLPIQGGLPRKLVPQDLFHSAQPFKHSETTTGTMLVTIQGVSSPWCHLCGTGFMSIQNPRVVGSKRLPLKFQKKAQEARPCTLERPVHEAKSKAESPETQRCQKQGISAKESCRQWLDSPKREAMRVSTGNAIGVGPHKSFGAHISAQFAPCAACGTTGIKVCPAWFQYYFDLNLPFLCISPFWNRDVYPVPLYAGSV